MADANLGKTTLNSLGRVPHVEEWKYLEYCLVQDPDGNIIHNASQQDSPVIRQKWSDGVYAMFNARSGKLLGRMFRLDKQGDYDYLPDGDIRELFFLAPAPENLPGDGTDPDGSVAGPNTQPAYTG